jgi:hypothetical protein
MKAFKELAGHFLFAILSFTLGHTSLGQSDNETSQGADIVKGAIMPFDKSITLGKAINTYPYFDSVAWTQATTKRGRNEVEAVGQIDFTALTMKDLPASLGHLFGASGSLPSTGDAVNARIVIRSMVNRELSELQSLKATDFKGARLAFQFILNVDGSFDLQSYQVTLLLADNKTLSLPVNDQEATSLLKEIYTGQLATPIAAIWLVRTQPKQITDKIEQ